MKCVAVSKEDAEAQAGASWLGKRRDSPICILLGRTLTLCVEEKAGGGIAYTCVWELSWASAHEGFLLSGSDTGQRDLAILALMYSTWLTFPVQLPTLGLSCQVPARSFLFSKLFSPAQRAQLISQCSHSSGGEFSWIVSSTEQQKQNLGDLIVAVTGSGIRTPLAKVNVKAGSFLKKRFLWNLSFLWGAKSIFHVEQNAKLFSADHSILCCHFYPSNILLSSRLLGFWALKFPYLTAFAPGRPPSRGGLTAFSFLSGCANFNHCSSSHFCFIPYWSLPVHPALGSLQPVNSQHDCLNCFTINHVYHCLVTSSISHHY